MAQEFKLKSVTSLDLKPGDKHEVEVEGLADAKVLLVNAGGKIQAIGPKCTHYGAPLVKGVLTTDGRITCPWHGACFSAKTGDVEDAPALDALPVFNVVERDGAVYVTGDEATIKAGRRKPKFQRGSVKKTSDEKRGVVVVGGGSACIGLVEELREQGFSDPITVVSNEGNLPIDRTKLSKALLTDLAKLQWRDVDFYKSLAVDFVHDEVTGVDFHAKSVETKGKQKLSYGKLVLATGGTARNLPLEGFKTLDNIFTLRNVHDAKGIVAAIGEAKGKKIVVIGSSFIGMEVANATAKDSTVTVVGMEKVPLERVLGEQIGRAAQKGLEKNGVKFYMEAGVDKAVAHTSVPSKVGAVLLKDGTSLEADLVVLGVGVAPATQFLRGNAGVQLLQDGSIEVDRAFAVKGLEDVYALGDIATFPYHGPAAGGKGVRIEHWNVAQQSGRIAARHMIAAGSFEPEFFTPIFWSALSAQVRYCGNTMASGWDDVVIQGSLDEGKWSAFYAKGDEVVAVATMGTDPAMVQCAELMRKGKMPKKSELEKGLDVMSLGTPQ